MFSVRTALTLTCVVTASGIAGVNQLQSTDDDANTTVAVGEIDAARHAEQSLDDYFAITEALLNDAADRKAEAEATKREALESLPVGTVIVTTDEPVVGMPEQWETMRQQGMRRVVQPPRRVATRPSAEMRSRKRAKARASLPTGRSRYSKYGSRQRDMFSRTRRSQEVKRIKRDREYRRRLQGNRHRVDNNRKPYSNRKSVFQKSKWGRNAEGRTRSRTYKLREGLHDARRRRR